MAPLPAHPTISVILCSYNRHPGLRRAVASVAAQTLAPAEVIVVDDGSDDARYGTPLPNVTWMRAEPNSRARCGFPCLGYVRNLGLACATGEWVAFLDDDDEWFPTKLERQIAALRATGCRMSCTEARRGSGPFRPEAEYPRYLAEWARRPTPVPERIRRGDLELDNPIIHSSVLIDRELVRTAGGYEELRLGGEWRDGQLRVEDYELWKRCLRHTDCAFVAEPMLYYDTAATEAWSKRFVAGARRLFARPKPATP